MSHPVSVDIVADFVCPWCWLGKRNWDKALALVSGVKVETIWRPYQLDPTLPREGRPYRAYMKAKFAGEEAAGRWAQMRDYLEAAAPDAGIEFRFDALEVRPNTLNAHRLMRWASGQGLAEPVAEALFRAFFADARDIGDRGVLVQLAGEAGMDAEIVAELLAGDKDAKAVWEEEMFYRKLGVSGVPTYIFNGQFAVSGAQDPETLADAIREASQAPADEDEENRA